jgi:hypothetical protein
MPSRYSTQQLEALAETALRDGYCVLQGHFPRARLQRWRDQFAPLLSEHIAREGHLRNRGAGRYYVTLPFTSPWADPEIFENDDVLAIEDTVVLTESGVELLTVDPRWPTFSLEGRRRPELLVR